MNATEIPLNEPSVSAAAGDAEQLERAYIDASTRVPVLMFYTSAMAWLILGTLLAGFISFKLHSPDLFSDISFLTWGRVRPAHMNVMVYGWASMAGMGTAIWLMARLGGTVLRYLLLLWFGAIGLGTAYYMIPKVIGRPVYSYHLATIGFWSYALFSSWTGMQRLVDGPFPAWMITASIAATILTMIPVATVGLNHHMTMQGYFPLMRYSPTLRFTVFGAMSYTVFSVVGVLISLRSVARYVNFTQASIAYSHLGLYAFFTMVIFGSMYYIVPRLVGREWRYASLIKLHFWASAYGIGL